MGLRGVPPSPLVYCNHRVRGKSKIKSWGRIVYGQNLEPQGLKLYWLIPPYTAFALAMFCSFLIVRKGRCHIAELWTSVEIDKALSCQLSTFGALHVPQVRQKYSALILWELLHTEKVKIPTSGNPGQKWGTRIHAVSRELNNSRSNSSGSFRRS